MNPPVPGLRRLWLNAVSPAKVSLSIPPGSVIEASEDVAAQLVAADPHFKDVAAEPVNVTVSVEAVAPSVEAGQAVVDAIKGKGKKG